MPLPALSALANTAFTVMGLANMAGSLVPPKPPKVPTPKPEKISYAEAKLAFMGPIFSTLGLAQLTDAVTSHISPPKAARRPVMQRHPAVTFELPDDTDIYPYKSAMQQPKLPKAQQMVQQATGMSAVAGDATLGVGGMGNQPEKRAAVQAEDYEEINPLLHPGVYISPSDPSTPYYTSIPV